jgi:hypothetical protein
VLFGASTVFYNAFLPLIAEAMPEVREFARENGKKNIKYEQKIAVRLFFGAFTFTN